jgi:hypothetical protein
MFEKSGIGADAAAADLELFGQFGEAERTAVNDQQAHDPACDAWNSVGLRD